MEHHLERSEKNTSQCLGNTQKQFPAIDNWKLKILQSENPRTMNKMHCCKGNSIEYTFRVELDVDSV
jgi:hypothetical protein